MKTKKIRHEVKNEQGRSLFVIDLVINEEPYIWKGRTFYSDYKHEINPAQLLDNQYLFLKARIMIHLPYDISCFHEDISPKISQIESFALTPNNSDESIKVNLIELANMIRSIPKIDYLFLPDVALNEHGIYDDTYIKNYVNQRDNHCFTDLSCPIGVFSIHLLNSAKGQIIDKNHYCFLLNCLSFANSYFTDETIQIEVKEVLELMDYKHSEYIVNLTQTKGHFLLTDDDSIIIYSNQDNEVVFGYVLK
jgi:hypothetical protein